MTANRNTTDSAFSIINLSASILNGCKDKVFLRSVAVSVFIKAHRGDSLFRNTSIRAIKSAMGVGQVRAKKVSETLKTDTRFFRYNKVTDTATARTFKTEAETKYTSRGKRMVCMYAVRLRIDKSWSLTKIERYIHDMLYLKAINATERSDKFNASRFIKNNVLLTTKDALTLTKMGHIGGVSRSTAKRHLERLNANNDISIKRGYTQVVLFSVNENTVRIAGLEHVNFIHDEKRNLGYIGVPNEYRIRRRELTDSFRNIILNSKRRQTYNAPVKSVDIMETELMGMFR